MAVIKLITPPIGEKDRDVIQEIQKDAVMGKFDILLVFMFNRTDAAATKWSSIIKVQSRSE